MWTFWLVPSFNNRDQLHMRIQVTTMLNEYTSFLWTENNKTLLSPRKLGIIQNPDFHCLRHPRFAINYITVLKLKNVQNLGGGGTNAVVKTWVLCITLRDQRVLFWLFTCNQQPHLKLRNRWQNHDMTDMCGSVTVHDCYKSSEYQISTELFIMP